jgi:histidinol-phosphate/aromatic aminotransferase/cobyric acid decarboxylase-like protein
MNDHDRASAENQEAVHTLQAALRSGYRCEIYDLLVQVDHDEKVVVVSTPANPVTIDSPRRKKSLT